MSTIIDNDITIDSRPYVIELQGYLRAIQRARQGNTTVPQDGYYGPATTEAVRQFQVEEDLVQVMFVCFCTCSPMDTQQKLHLM